MVTLMKQDKLKVPVSNLSNLNYCLQHVDIRRRHAQMQICYSIYMDVKTYFRAVIKARQLDRSDFLSEM